jgi:hypothetical protein
MLISRLLISRGGDGAMRYTTHALLGVVLAGVVGTRCTAEEAKAPWWHFGKGGSATDTSPTMNPAPTITPAVPPSAQVSADDSWFTLPKWSWLEPKPESAQNAQRTQQSRSHMRFGKPIHRNRPRNTWAQPPADATAQAPGSSTWQSMTNGTRTAWRKTVDFVTPGTESEASIAHSEPRVSWWDRMWGTEETTQEGPQTVTEWMAQERLDP